MLFIFGFCTRPNVLRAWTNSIVDTNRFEVQDLKSDGPYTRESRAKDGNRPDSVGPIFGANRNIDTRVFRKAFKSPVIMARWCDRGIVRTRRPEPWSR